MPKHTPGRVTSHTPIGPDVDLDRDDIRLADGTRLTQDVAHSFVEHARRVAGRPSLSGNAEASPQIAFRVAPDVRDRAAQVAAREGKTISQLAFEVVSFVPVAGVGRSDIATALPVGVATTENGLTEEQVADPGHGVAGFPNEHPGG
jgi:hypothetical protein